MKWDRLLEWMAHLGSGTWKTFTATVDALVGNHDSDTQLLHRNLRIALSDLGHADFFVGGSRRWRTRRPALVGLSTPDFEHIFTGGRTATVASELSLAAQNANAVVTTEEDFPELSRIYVKGEPERIARIAQDLGMDYVRNGAKTLADHLTPLHSSQVSTEAEEPIGWHVRSWSFAHVQWVDGRLHHSLREYSNRYGGRRYLVHTGRRKPLREMDRRAGMYCAALAARKRLIKFSEECQTLLVPRWAPLPPEHARIACLAGGRLATVTGRHIVFHGVQYQIASTLLASLGQMYGSKEFANE